MSDFFSVKNLPGVFNPNITESPGCASTAFNMICPAGMIPFGTQLILLLSYQDWLYAQTFTVVIHPSSIKPSQSLSMPSQVSFAPGCTFLFPSLQSVLLLTYPDGLLQAFTLTDVFTYAC